MIAPQVRHALLRLVAVLGCVVLLARPAAAGPHIVVDEQSGLVLSQDHAFDPWHPASVTKLMTVYTVLRAIKAGRIAFDSPVRQSFQASQQPPSKMGFDIGTILTVETALKILMVKSANDISVAVGEATSGTQAAFAEEMNWNARALGLGGTWYVNPHGLHEPQQVTNVRDMALLSAALLREFPEHADLFSIPALRFGKTRLTNHNRLMSRIVGVNGMKTGFVCASGFNVVARATRGGRSITAVVFGGRTARERDALAAELIEHAFATKPEKAVHPRLASLAPPLALPAPANIRDFVCEKPDGVHRWNANGHPYARAAETLKDREARLYQKDLPRSGDVRIELGGAFGPNPFEFAVVDGGTPPPFIPIPVGRPWHDGDPTPNPHPDLRLAEPQYATGGVAPLPLPRPQLAEKAASTPVSAYQ